jgi:hypothetical protein
VIFRRGRFDDLVRRQLDLFEVDHATLLQEAEAAESAWTNAGASESEELYGEYQLVVDTIGELLYNARETYASSLDEPAAQEYRNAFDRAANKRFRGYASFLEDE